MILKSLFFFYGSTLLVTTVCAKSNRYETADERLLIGELLERVTALEERDARQQKLIADLQNELSGQKKEIGRMKHSLAARDHRIWLLIRSLKRQNSEKDAKKETDRSKRLVDHTSVETGQTVRRIRQTENEVTIAFSAALSKTMTQLGIHQNIVFDYVFTNLGKAYNPHHGVFIAPVSGTYVFFMTIYATHNNDIWCQYVVNGIHKSTVFAESLNSADDTGSQTIILQLQQGDDVAIQLIRGTVEIYGSDNLYNTFSGFLLKQDYSQPDNIVG